MQIDILFKIINGVLYFRDLKHSSPLRLRYRSSSVIVKSNHKVSGEPLKKWNHRTRTRNTNPNLFNFLTFIFYHCYVLKPRPNGLASSRSSGKLNLRRDLRWVAKQTRKFPHEHASRKKKHFKADISCISLANNTLMDITQLQLALTWVGRPNDEKLALTCVQI